MAIGLLGRKVGMTQIYDSTGDAITVTVIQAGPCQVLQVKSRETDGYDAVQVGFDPVNASRVRRPQAGHVKKAGAKAMRFVREFRIETGESYEPGANITVGDLKGVACVDVTGQTKGKGFQGVMKRWGFGGQPGSHGTERKHRSAGSIGSGAVPDKGVLPGHKMPGHMGRARRTVQSLPVIRLDPEKNLLVVKGSVPGPSGGYVMIRRSVKG